MEISSSPIFKGPKVVIIGLEVIRGLGYESLPIRLEDSDIKEYLMTFMGKVPNLEYEIPNPRVDLYGDTAVFTFNEKTTDPKNGAVVRWNVTLVFTRTRDGWKRVHANWAYAEPPGS